jgi:IS5 family transposase
MHNLKTNFDKIYLIVKSSLSDRLNSMDNLQFYPNLPKMNDCSIITLSICAESLGIDSENYLWSKLKKDYSNEFPELIDRSNFNKRRRRLQPYIHEVTKQLSMALNDAEDVFLVDSIPIPVSKIAREKRCKFGSECFENAPDKGYSAVTKSYYYGYKLHLVTSIKGIFHSMDLTKASVHDVSYLQEIKCSGMNNATLIGDKGYLSKQVQTDLFNQCNIRLETPKRNNQKDREAWHPVFRKSRKRIETLFSQLCDQMMLKRNYAKSIDGLKVRLISKIAAVTLLQHINHQQSKPINHLKHALAA